MITHMLKNGIPCFAGSLLMAAAPAFGEPAAAPARGAKALVVVYSWSGNTLAVAEAITNATGAALVRLQPKDAYPSDYGKCCDQAKIEINRGYHPAVTNLPDIAAYDVVFVGSPDWWGTIAPPVSTFLASAKLESKKVVPFFTNGGGGLQNCERAVQKACPKSTVLPAITLSGSSCNDKKWVAGKINAWLRKNGF